MAITSSRAISGPAIIAGLGGGNAVGTNATATGATLTNSLSTGNATNPNFVIQVGVATSSGAAQATATTALTIAGETLAATFAGTVSVPTGSAQLKFSTDLLLGRGAAANLRLGAADVDTAPVAQTLSVQNTLASGTSNVAGANFTIAGSQGKGTGVGGSLIFQVAPAGSTGTAVNALATALTIDSTKLATFAAGITIGGQLSTAGQAILGNRFIIDTGRLSLATSMNFAWSSSNDPTSTQQTSLSQISSGVLGVGTGTQGSIAGTLQLATILVNADRGLTAANQTVTGGAQVGTLTNAPTAGNPTVWLRTTINGVSIVFPGWPG